jgi:FkbM family methyltransferase
MQNLVKINLEKFENNVRLSKKNKQIQAILHPLHIFLYFMYSRIPFMLHKPIHYKAELFFGKKIAGVFPDPVFGHLYLYGFMEEDLTRALISFLKKDMVFLDVGAHVGYFSALAAVLVGKKGSVHSFEATPRTYQFLKKNISQFDNVQTNLEAVWSKNGFLDFYDYGPFYAQCNSFTKAKLEKKILEEIKPIKFKSPSITIDTYCTKRNIKPNFIKIDAESAEFEILKGMTQVLKKYSPIISLEIGDLPHIKKDGSKDCIKLLKNLKYTPYNYKDGEMVEHTIKKDYYNMYDNLIFFPANKI